MENNENYVCKVFRGFGISMTDATQIFLGKRNNVGLVEITAELHYKYPTVGEERQPLKPFLQTTDNEMLQAISQALYDAGFKPKGAEIIETEKVLLREIIDIKKDESLFYRKLIHNDKDE